MNLYDLLWKPLSIRQYGEACARKIPYDDLGGWELDRQSAWGLNPFNAVKRIYWQQVAFRIFKLRNVIPTRGRYSEV